MWLLLQNLIKKQEVVRWQQGFERETNGEKVEFAEKLRGRGWVSVFGKTRKRRVLHQSSMLCNGLRVISRLELCPQFIFQLNYENDVKIWLLKLFLQK